MRFIRDTMTPIETKDTSVYQELGNEIFYLIQHQSKQHKQHETFWQENLLGSCAKKGT